MERIVICDECGYINDAKEALIKDNGYSTRLFMCKRCGNTFFKLDYQLKIDARKVRRENNSKLGKAIKNLETEMKGWGEEDRKLQIFGEILVEIAKNSLKNS